MKPQIYRAIITRIFLSKYKPGATSVDFHREEIPSTAGELGLTLPKNYGDLIYTFRFRQPLPEEIRKTAPEGKVWIIRGRGTSQYQFALISDRPLLPNEQLLSTKVPDATPGIVAKYSLNDEQALLAKVRYNRLIDLFLGLACYSLQNHLRYLFSGVVS